jgi:hypothetical protein
MKNIILSVLFALFVAGSCFAATDPSLANGSKSVENGESVDLVIWNKDQDQQQRDLIQKFKAAEERAEQQLQELQKKSQTA